MTNDIMTYATIVDPDQPAKSDQGIRCLLM